MNETTERILYPLIKYNEKLLWTGAPEPGFRFRLGEYIVLGMGVGFAGIPLIAMLTGGVGFFMLIFFFLPGVCMLFFGLFTGWYVRRNSLYALTDQRAFLIFSTPLTGVQVKSYPIKPVMSIEKIGPHPASVYFAKSRRVEVQGVPMYIGFAMIKDADMVYDLLREQQFKLR